MSPPSTYIVSIAVILQTIECRDEPTGKQEEYCRNGEIEQIH